MLRLLYNVFMNSAGPSNGPNGNSGPTNPGGNSGGPTPNNNNNIPSDGEYRKGRRKRMGERASRHYRIIIDPSTPRDVADVYRDHLREVTRTYLSEEDSMVRDNVLSRSACRPTTP